MSRPPCIRGLKQFKQGCPQRSWNGHNGCPAWVEELIPSRDNPTERKPANMCVDVYAARLQWDTNAMLQGIQQAIERFRNGMLEFDEGDKRFLPRTSLGVKVLVNLIEEEMKTREIIYAHEARKQIGSGTDQT